MGKKIIPLHRPGIEPGPPAWQASILPLNQRCFACITYYYMLPLREERIYASIFLGRFPLPLSSCPIAGEYTGNLPDAPRRLCAKMSSDCNNPDTIFYSVFSCANATQVFEGKNGIAQTQYVAINLIVLKLLLLEREYQCLGQWEEDGQLFAYTRRRDLISSVSGAFECFVGRAGNNYNNNSSSSSDDDGSEIFLMEGGANCRRGLRVEEFGMRLTRQSKWLFLAIPRLYLS